MLFQRATVKIKWKDRKALKELWIVRETVIPIVVGVLGTIPKGLEKRLEQLEIRGRIETI